MEYETNKLAKLAGVSARTLRYYHEIGLLCPARVGANGYRVYGAKEVSLLQQILFYRSLCMPLENIQTILQAEDFSALAALESHRQALLAKRQALDALLRNVNKSIRALKGEEAMTDAEKFEGFKQKLVSNNEQNYGEELRKKYGPETVQAANKKVLALSMEDQAEIDRISAAFAKTIRAAMAEGNPASETAQQACALHKEWLSFYWPIYSKEAHMGVTQLYVDDARFTAHYDAIAPGCAVFLRDAVQIFCAGQQG